MGAASRQKGKRGEREVAAILRAHGFDARRDGRLAVDLVHNVPGVHFEVKRCEVYSVRKWARQAEAEAPAGCVPIVVFRSSGEPWRAELPLADLARILSGGGLRAEDRCPADRPHLP